MATNPSANNPSANTPTGNDSSPNQEQIDFWSGDRGKAWADSAERYDLQLERYSLLAVGAAAPLPGDRAIDVGCGAGATTFEAARAVGPTGYVIGVDVSGPMLERARHEQERTGLTNVEFVEADVQTMTPLTELADVVVSRFGVMFFDDPIAAFANLAAMVRDRGRLGFACWGPASSNEWMSVPAVALAPIAPLPEPSPADAPGPFSFADQDRVESILEAAGWSDVTFEVVDDPLYLGGPGSLAEVVEFVLGASSLSPLVADRREEARQLLSDALAPRFDGHGVKFHANAHIVRAVREA